MNLRDEARGRPCLIRVPGYCAPGPGNEAVCLCHVRLITVSGMGIKSADIFGAFGCHSCHQVVDGQQKTAFSAEQRRLMLLEGMMRTQFILLREGKIKA